MLIALVGLGLVVVFLAMKTNAASGESLPPPPDIPATGTSGVPSPGPEQTNNPVGTTKLGRLSMFTTGGLVNPITGQFTPQAALGSTSVSSTPLGVPDQVKDLDTQGTSPQVTLAFNAPPSGRLSKL